MTYQLVAIDQNELCNLSELSQRIRPNSLLIILNRKGEMTESHQITHNFLGEIGIKFAEHAYSNFATGNCQEPTHDAIGVLSDFARHPGTVTADEVIAAAEHADNASALRSEDKNNIPEFRLFEGKYSNADLYTTETITSAAYFAMKTFLVPNSDGMWHAEDANFRDIATLAARAAYRKGGGRAEYVRQGEFIMEYLRTGSI